MSPPLHTADDPATATPVAIDRLIAALAERQDGVVSRIQLLALDVGEGAIKLRLRTGRLHQLHVGVYAVGHRVMSERGRLRAALLACGPGAVVSHRSAARLWGLRWAHPARPEIIVSGRSHRRRPGVAIHRPRVIRAEDVTSIAGFPTTTPARTLFDLAHDAPRRELADALEQADVRRLLDLRPLDALIARHPATARARALSGALQTHRPDVATESKLESRFRDLCHRAGIAAALVDHWMQLPDGRWIRPDAQWPAERVIVEVDGYAVHRTRSRWESDRLRDADLQEMGYLVIRVTERQLDHAPDEIAARLHRVLASRR
jgi:predicted transcriptional regulator of viral defense system